MGVIERQGRTTEAKGKVHHVVGDNEFGLFLAVIIPAHESGPSRQLLCAEENAASRRSSQSSGVSWNGGRTSMRKNISPARARAPTAAFTTIMSWSPYGDSHPASAEYGQKDRSFEPYFSLPNVTGVPMELAAAVPAAVRERLEAGGWRLSDPIGATLDPGLTVAFDIGLPWMVGFNGLALFAILLLVLAGEADQGER